MEAMDVKGPRQDTQGTEAMEWRKKGNMAGDGRWDVDVKVGRGPASS